MESSTSSERDSNNLVRIEDGEHICFPGTYLSVIVLDVHTESAIKKIGDVGIHFCGMAHSHSIAFTLSLAVRYTVCDTAERVCLPIEVLVNKNTQPISFTIVLGESELRLELTAKYDNQKPNTIILCNA